MDELSESEDNAIVLPSSSLLESVFARIAGIGVVILACSGSGCVGRLGTAKMRRA